MEPLACEGRSSLERGVFFLIFCKKIKKNTPLSSWFFERIPFICFLLLCVPSLARAQGRTFLPDAHPKTQTALKVYKTIKPFIYNHKNKGLPDLAIVKKQLIPKPASYDDAANCIYLEEKAFDVCMSFGADSLSAVAVLIAHEAMHFFKKHGGSSGFACAFFETEATLDDVKEKQETEADLWGLFTAYLAGYEVAELTPKMLNLLYKKYGLDDETPGYPSLQTRQKMFARSLQKLQDLTALYEAGNYLVMLGEHDKAAACFQNILEDYQSQEMYNNLGVALASYAASLFDNLPVYPFEIDLQSRLYRKPPPFGLAPEDIKKYWLQEAEKVLLDALELKPDYVPALLNLAIVYDMQGRHEEARSSITKARQLPLNGSQDDHLAVLEAIVEWHDGNTGLARNILLAQVENLLALQTLRFFENGISPQSTPPPSQTPLDQPCGENLTTNWKGAKTVALKKGILPEFSYEFFYKNTPCFFAFSIARKGSVERAYLQRTRQPDQKTLKKAGKGYGYSALLERYDDQNCMEAYAAKNTFVACHEQGLFFRLDERQVVDEWGVFKIISR